MAKATRKAAAAVAAAQMKAAVAAVVEQPPQASLWDDEVPAPPPPPLTPLRVVRDRYEEGEVVELRSGGGFLMTVSAVKPDGRHTVVWMDREGRLHSTDLSPLTLRVARTE